MDNIIRAAKKKRQKRNYFTQETENAIVAYNNSDDDSFKSAIYSREIHYPFYKLTQNIIHTFKFYYTDGVENLEDLQHEIIVFLLDKIHLFDVSKGAKAYSYFGTIVKRWLIVYNQKNYTKKIQSVDIGDISKHQNLDLGDDTNFISNTKLDQTLEKFSELDRNFGDELYVKGYKEGDRLSIFIDLYVKYITDNIYTYFPKEYDAQIADCILELFRKRDAIDVFNKKALYIYIREMIDVKTPKITKIANKLHKVFKEKYLVYHDKGYFPY
jgi:hypothetical protein|tara:strand:+ start:528 stop:1337 length:810 start_codon:yes stop_codon:yes gene_type:complete